MQLGLIGLGKMGGNMRERIRRAGHTVVGYDRNPDLADVHSLADLVGKLSGPRVVWVMVPAGAPTQSTIDELAELLEAGDVVVDGGNSRWTDDEKHAAELGTKGVGFVDAGVSGGVWGLENGYALMVGGDEKHVERLKPIFDHFDGRITYDQIRLVVSHARAHREEPAREEVAPNASPLPAGTRPQESA